MAEAKPELTFGMMFNQRTNALYQKIKKVIDNGEIGNIRRTNWIITTWWRPQAYFDDSDWRATYACGLQDRKSTRLNSSHVAISYAVFCLKKKKKKKNKKKTNHTQP